MSTGGAGVKAGRAFVLFEVLDKTAKGMKAIAGRLDRMSQRIGNIGRQLTFLGAAMAVPFTIAINSAKDLTDELLKLKAVLQADVRTMDQLEKRIRGLGKTTSFTSIQVAEAATALGRGGFSSQEIEASLKEVLNLARTGSLEMGRAATIMVDSIRNFGLAAKDSEKVASAFFVAATKGTITVEELAQSFKFSGGSMAELGLSLNEGLAVLSQISKAMLKGTVGGTSFNQMLLAIGNNADKLQEIGVDPFDASGQLKPALELFKDLSLTLRAMPPAERLPVMADIFNVRGMRAAGAMARMMNEIDDAFIAIENSAGRAAEASRTMDSGIGGSIRRIISATTDLQESIGIAFTQSFQKLEKAIIPVINRLSDWAAQNKELFVQAAKIVVGITAAGIALIALSGVLAVVGGIIAGVSVVLSTLAGTGGILALAFVGAATNIIAMGAVLFSIWDRIKVKTLDLVNFIIDEFTTIKDILVSVFTDVADILSEFDLTDFISQIVNILIPAIKFNLSNISLILQVLIKTNSVGIVLVGLFQDINRLTGGWLGTILKLASGFGLILLAVEKINEIAERNAPELVGLTDKAKEKLIRAKELKKIRDAQNAEDRLRKSLGLSPIDRGRSRRPVDPFLAKPKGPTPKQIEAEKERRSNLADLQAERSEAKRSLELEDRNVAQSQKEQRLQRNRTIEERKRDLKELLSIELSISREADEKKRRQLQKQREEFRRQLREQRENEANAAIRTSLSEAERLDRRRKSVENILRIERGIRGLGGRPGRVEPIATPRVRPGVAATTRLDPRVRARARVELRGIAVDERRRKLLEERRELVSATAGRGPSIQGVGAGSIAGLQQAFGNQEEQKQSMILNRIDKGLEEIERRIQAGLRVLELLGVPVGGEV